MVGKSLIDAVNREIFDFPSSRLKQFVDEHGPYIIKFVHSRWADHYSRPRQLKISETPALTWGTATYVTPLAFPLSSALYGRIGLVSTFNPNGWRIFDATRPSAELAYIRWVQAQPAYTELISTVHSTHANHLLRNTFRQNFRIDCVLFHPDQEAENHTDVRSHVWMAVTDWTAAGRIASDFSNQFIQARFTVLLDEDFVLQDNGLPIRTAKRQIEQVTELMHRSFPTKPIGVSSARVSTILPSEISSVYARGGYLHVYIDP